MCVFLEDKVEIKKNGNALANPPRQANDELEINPTTLNFTIPERLELQQQHC